jgi:2Fe-2S ferredoxin
MPIINVTNRFGDRERLTTDHGEFLMIPLRDNDVGVDATCGGSCSCATCHVYVENLWLCKLNPRSKQEEETLAEMVFAKSNSRLACQIKMTPELDGIAVEIAPPEG